MSDKKKRLRGRLNGLYDIYRKTSYGDNQQTTVDYFRRTNPRIVLGLVKARLIRASDPL